MHLKKSMEVGGRNVPIASRVFALAHWRDKVIKYTVKLQWIDRDMQKDWVSEAGCPGVMV
jgi:hypothetical protein